MFCRAPAAASRVVELISQRCSTWLYNSTILGCQSHSMSAGCRDTSANVVRSWFCLWKYRQNMRLSCNVRRKLVYGNRYLKAASPYVFGLLAIRGEATDSFSFWRALSSARTLQPCQCCGGNLTVQLIGQIPQHTHCVLHTLKEEHQWSYKHNIFKQSTTEAESKVCVTQLPSPPL